MENVYPLGQIFFLFFFAAMFFNLNTASFPHYIFKSSLFFILFQSNFKVRQAIRSLISEIKQSNLSPTQNRKL